jgi:3-deoxy-D-manno-octulosonic-acid transferase
MFTYVNLKFTIFIKVWNSKYGLDLIIIINSNLWPKNINHA